MENQKSTDCLEQVCQNGGTCIVSSVLPAVTNCKPGEIFHMGYCYSYDLTPRSWLEAADFCSKKGSTLASIENPDDQTFYAGYVQGALAGVQQTNEINGIWTSIRAVMNGTRPVWVSFPGSYRVDNTFWAQFEPNIYLNYNEICVNLEAETNYRQWRTDLCTHQKYVVCKKEVKKEDPQYVGQCLCPTSFNGVYCELPNDNEKSRSENTCAGVDFQYACSNGQTIIVDFASFGAIEGYTCQQQVSGQQTCSNANSLQTVTNALGSTLITGIDNQLFDQLAIQLKSRTKESALYWIGLNLDGPGPVWTDGSSPSYLPPDNNLRQSATDCAVLAVADNRLIYDQQPCSAQANVLCQAVPSSRSTPERQSQPAPPTPPPPTRIIFEGTMRPKNPMKCPLLIFDPVNGTSDPNVPSSLLEKRRYCKKEKYQGIEYPKTRACQQTELPCPFPEAVVGTVYRYCNCQTGKWDLPNTTNCTHKWVGEIKDSVARGDAAESISTMMSRQLRDTIARQLFGGDITGSVQISSDVLNLARSQFEVLDDRNNRQTRATNFTQSLGSSGDQLLSSKAASVWKQLDADKRVGHASTLMSVLEQSTLLLADYMLERQAQYQYDHWAMEVEVKPPQDAPQNRMLFAQAVPGPMDDMASFNSPGPSSDGPFKFSSINKSPLIQLPSFNTLRTSANTGARPAATFTSQTFFHPGDEEVSINAAPPPPTLDRSPLKLSYYAFTSFGDLLTKNEYYIVNSHVIGAAVDNATKSLQLPEDQPVTFTFYHLQTSGVSNPRCVFWDLDLKDWSTAGCTLLNTTATSTQCSCTHLTSFAILMDVSGNVGRFTGNLASALDVISTIGCAISIVCLALSLLVFTFFRNLYNVRNSIHRNLCLCLLVAELVFVIGMDRTGNRTGCGIVAILLHYFFLASFCWMLLEGYQLYLMLIQVFEPNRTRIVLYYVFCYGCPAIIVAISAGIDWKNYGTETYCWIDTSTPTIWAFVAPILVIIAANIMFLLIALKVVLSVQSRDRTKWDRIIGWLKGSATLLCLLGITWLFGFLTAVKGGTGTVFAWIFTILNCTQGVFIFFLHVVMNEKVRLAVVRWLRSGVCCLPETSSVYNSRSFVSSRQRILNMMNKNTMGHSVPSTASTDDKDKQLTPISKTTDWLRRMPLVTPQDSISTHDEHEQGLSIDDVTIDHQIHMNNNNNNNNNNNVISHDMDRGSLNSDPRGSQVVEDLPVEKKAPVKRKKFPLGATNSERGSQHQSCGIIVHRL
ncbi:unnamed protein product [Caenorhabditis auriculariae]|uniref:Uncharacterized protein n=1 Tax=Caenorhabditis auriculariae TaxID=2777116 RepID=A0A8S1H3T8_9PELO|nr:unnamed protein product [Caenorhabditis auriculariae]